MCVIVAHDGPAPPNRTPSSIITPVEKEDMGCKYLVTLFIIYKVMKYRKILIKYNAYFKKAVFHRGENIKSCISQR